MEEFLIIIIQCIFEVLLNVLPAFPLESIFYIGENEETNSVLRCAWSFVFGLLMGGVSLLIFHKSLVSIPYLRIIILFSLLFLRDFCQKKLQSLFIIKKMMFGPKDIFGMLFGYV